MSDGNMHVETRVWTFFYGSYINLDVLAEVGLRPSDHEVARLSGFDILIRPLANLIRSDQHAVYGIVTTATHAELERLYRHAENVLGGVYLPEAVIVETRDGKVRPALCYLSDHMEAHPATDDYVNRIVQPAREYGFPDWYIARLQSFRERNA